MGAGASFMSPSCVVSTGFCLALVKFSGIGFLLPLACEVAHGVAGQLLYSEGRLDIEREVYDVLNWTITEFGIRCFSLNFCGKFNHLFDTLRRCLAPLSSWRSGRMIHDVVVVCIEDNQTKSQAFALFCKAHNGDLEVRFCRDLHEVDEKGKPEIFGRPPSGRWKRRVKSNSLMLKDVLEECQRMPAQYQPVTNNCHHFSTDLWNWHTQKLKEIATREEEFSISTSTDRVRFLQWPRGRLRAKNNFAPLISRTEIVTSR